MITACVGRNVTQSIKTSSIQAVITGKSELKTAEPSDN